MSMAGKEASVALKYWLVPLKTAVSVPIFAAVVVVVIELLFVRVPPPEAQLFVVMAPDSNE